MSKNTNQMNEAEQGEETYCAYLDILGFKDIVGDWDSAVKYYNFLTTLITGILEGAKTVIPKGYDNTINTPLNLNYSIISDSVILSYNNLSVLTNTIFVLNFILMEHDYFTRGGISYGKHLSENKDGNYFIISQPLSKSVPLEKKAIWPRIIIDDSILKDFIPYNGNQNGLFDGALFQHYDGLWAINPFMGLHLNALNPIKTNLEKKMTMYHKDNKKYFKYYWLHLLLIEWMNVHKQFDHIINNGISLNKNLEKKKNSNERPLSNIFLLHCVDNENRSSFPQLGRSYQENLMNYPYA